MVLLFTISGIFAIIAGIIILVWPKTLNIVVGLWLLLTGFLQVFS